jgi:hypothetical protein
VSDKRQPPVKTSALLGDLESIRSLLAEHQEGGRPASAGPDDEVPLLEDVVQGGVSVNEAFLAGEGDFEDSGSASGIDDDVFKALLSNEWRDRSHAGVTGAGTAIDSGTTPPVADVCDELNAAIMAKVDEALKRWLREAVLEGMDDLRRQLLVEVRQQLNDVIRDAQLKETSPDEDPDGA